MVKREFESKYNIYYYIKFKKIITSQVIDTIPFSSSLKSLIK